MQTFQETDSGSAEEGGGAPLTGVADVDGTGALVVASRPARSSADGTATASSILSWPAVGMRSPRSLAWAGHMHARLFGWRGHVMISDENKSAKEGMHPAAP